MLNLIFEAGLGTLKWLLDAPAARIVFPAVVGAADAVVFDEPIVKRRATMGTMLSDQAVVTGAVAIEQ